MIKKNNVNNRIDQLLLTIGFILLVMLFGSCKTKTVYLPIESSTTSSNDRLERDSTRLIDSVYVHRWMAGDTVFQIQERYKYLYRDRLVRDSVYIRDTIRVPYPMVETKTVKAPYTWFEKILLALGCGFLGYTVFRTYKWIKK